MNTLSGYPRSLVLAFTLAIVAFWIPSVILAQTIPQATIMVETADDSFDGDGGACSLSEAVAYADGTFVDDCFASSSTALVDTILFTDSLAGATIIVSPTLRIGNAGNIGDSLTIRGSVPITISGGDVTRIFEITGYSSTITLDSINLTAGTANSGGAIYFDDNQTTSSLNVNNSRLFGNRATSFRGGAIVFGIAGTDSVLTINNSMLFDNSAAGEGGAIDNTGMLTITNSTFANNQSDEDGGAIFNIGGVVNIVNSTLSNNSAQASGGAIANFDPERFTYLSVRHSTVIANRAESDGGISNTSSYVEIESSILAGNTNGDCGDIHSLGFNLFSTFSSCSLTTTDIITNSANLLINPLLTDNGGSTLTHALLPRSPAIDAITDPAHCTLLTDQRGVARDTRCDIGAYEFPPSVTLGDRVWLDLNANGIQDAAEPGLFNIRVILWIDDGADGVPDTQVFSTTTDSNGNYLFDRLDPNNAYVIQFVDPAGHNFTRPIVQDEAVDSNADPATGLTASLSLLPGARDETVDGGYLPEYQLALAPASANRTVGTAHTVTAHVEANIGESTTPLLRPVANMTVRFTVRGVNSTDGPVSTDSNGDALFTYPYRAAVNLSASDTITALLDLSAIPGVASPVATATVNWQPLTMSIERSGVWVVEGEVEWRFMTATILSAAATPVPGLSVGFEVTQNNVQPVETRQTNANGQAFFNYISSAVRLEREATVKSAAENQPTAQLSPATLCNSAVGGETDIITIWVDTDGNGQFNGTELFDQCEIASAITLLTLSAQDNHNGTVTIRWQTATEFDNAGFHLYRATTPDGPFSQITEQLIGAQGNGSGTSYSFVDTPPGAAPFYYKLEDVDLNGKGTFHGPVQATDGIATDDQSVRIFLPLLWR